MIAILEAARTAYAAGLSVLPVRDDGTKAPALTTWRTYLDVRPTVEEMRAWQFDTRDGFGVIAGAVSGYVECWDFDDAATCAAFESAAHASGLGAVWARLTAGYLDATPGGGFRILARYPADETFTDCTLARRPGREGEPKIKTLIELPTFALVAPAAGKTHPSGRAYTRLSGDFTTIAAYTTDERRALMALARTFDQLSRPEHRTSTATATPTSGTRPGDDYNRRTTWPALLEPQGWTVVFERDDVTYWRRPGKSFGVSATTNYAGSDLFYPFTSSTMFEPDKSYTKFGVLTLLEYEGDYSRAALALFKDGYGADVDDDTATETTRTTAEPSAPSSDRLIHVTAADAIVIEPVRWLWADWIPLGSFVLLGGREGIGKSIISYTLAADTTRGRLPGAYATVPRGVLVCATEDSWSHTIVPRLMAADADLSRVFRVDVLAPDGAELALTLPKDTAGLDAVVRQTDAALLIFDPLLSRLDARIDSHKDADTRRALEPLAALARTANVTCLGLIHVSKSSSVDALTLLMASRAFTAVARAVLFILIDPENDARRVLGLAKNNLGRTDLPLRAFEITGVLVATTDAGEVWTGKAEWLGESDRSLRDLVEQAAADRPDPTAMQEATDWLVDFLTEKGGCLKRTVIVDMGRRAGHSRATLDRVRHKAQISSKTQGFPREAYWILPPIYGRDEWSS